MLPEPVLTYTESVSIDFITLLPKPALLIVLN